MLAPPNIIRKLNAPEALAAELQADRGQTEKRGGYMPSQVMTLKEAKRRCIPIDERIHAP
jgi:hypothetical protein